MCSRYDESSLALEEHENNLKDMESSHFMLCNLFLLVLCM